MLSHLCKCVQYNEMSYTCITLKACKNICNVNITWVDEYVWMSMYVRGGVHVCKHACMCVCLYVCMCECMYTYTCVRVSDRDDPDTMYVCTHACMHVRTYARTPPGRAAGWPSDAPSEKLVPARERTCHCESWEDRVQRSGSAREQWSWNSWGKEESKKSRWGSEVKDNGA